MLLAAAFAAGGAGALLLAVLFVYLTGCAPRAVLTLEARLFRAFKRRKPWGWHQVDELLYVGSLPRWPEHLAELRGRGVRALLCLTEPWELALSIKCVREDCGMDARQLATPDFFAPTQRDLVEAVAFISGHVKAGRGVYVHCNGGKGRSAVAVLCYLMYARGETAASAYALVRSKRRIADLRALCGLRTQWRAVVRFERELGAVRAELAARGAGGDGGKAGRSAAQDGASLWPAAPPAAGDGAAVGKSATAPAAARRAQVVPVAPLEGQASA